MTYKEYFCNRFNITECEICWSNLFTGIKEFFSSVYWFPARDPFIKEDFKNMLQQETVSELKDLLCKTNNKIEKVNTYKKIVDDALKDIYDIIYKNGYVYEQTTEQLKDFLNGELFPCLFNYGEILNQIYQIIQNTMDKKVSNTRNLENVYKNDLSKYSTDDLLKELKRRIEKQ